MKYVPEEMTLAATSVVFLSSRTVCVKGILWFSTVEEELLKAFNVVLDFQIIRTQC